MVDEANSNRAVRRVFFLAALSGAVLITAVIVLSALRLFWFTHYRIPQNGMYPTTPEGSYVVARRRPYASASEVQRGDVVVFIRNKFGRPYIYIWRVIGLPGESVTTRRDGTVAVDGVTQKQHLVEERGSLRIMREVAAGTSYTIALESTPASPRRKIVTHLGPRQFFVMGDNRDHASDSREFGAIEFSAIIGKQVWQP